jgi:hypothetical protein
VTHPQFDASALLDALDERPDLDLVREMVTFLYQALIDAEKWTVPVRATAATAAGSVTFRWRAKRRSCSATRGRRSAPVHGRGPR